MALVRGLSHMGVRYDGIQVIRIAFRVYAIERESSFLVLIMS
jgi:hypothetical protein